MEIMYISIPIGSRTNDHSSPVVSGRLRVSVCGYVSARMCSETTGF